MYNDVVLEEIILLVTLVHVAIIANNEYLYDKRKVNICRSFEGCRQTFKDYKFML